MQGTPGRGAGSPLLGGCCFQTHTTAQGMRTGSAFSDLQGQLCRCFSDLSFKTTTKNPPADPIYTSAGIPADRSPLFNPLMQSLCDMIHRDLLLPFLASGHFCHPPKTEDTRRHHNGIRGSVWPAKLRDNQHPKMFKA